MCVYISCLILFVNEKLCNKIIGMRFSYCNLIQVWGLWQYIIVNEISGQNVFKLCTFLNCNFYCILIIMHSVIQETACNLKIFNIKNKIQLYIYNLFVCLLVLKQTQQCEVRCSAALRCVSAPRLGAAVPQEPALGSVGAFRFLCHHLVGTSGNACVQSVEKQYLKYKQRHSKKPEYCF